MCGNTTEITPTRRTVYHRKETAVKAKSSARFVLEAGSSSGESSDDHGHTHHKFVIRCKSSCDLYKKGKKKGKCTCGAHTGDDEVEGRWYFKQRSKDDKHKKKTKVMKFKARSGDYCHCAGRGSDGWLCDKCRSEEKKTGFWRFVARDSDSGSDSDSDSCSECGHDCDCACGCEQDDDDFAEECKAWMAAAAKKRKKERKRSVGCNCHRPGCNICFFFNC